MVQRTVLIITDSCFCLSFATAVVTRFNFSLNHFRGSTQTHFWQDTYTFDRGGQAKVTYSVSHARQTATPHSSFKCPALEGHFAGTATSTNGDASHFHFGHANSYALCANWDKCVRSTRSYSYWTRQESAYGRSSATFRHCATAQVRATCSNTS